MKNIIAFSAFAILSLNAFASSTTELIKNNVENSFKQSAISLISNADIKEVELVDNRVVVSLNTNNKYFEVKVKNGADSFTKKKSLDTIKIPFPKTGDLEECFGDQVCPSTDYLHALKSYGLTQTSSETISNGRMELYFTTIEYRSLFKANQDILVGFTLTPDSSSFDRSNNLSFLNNGCDHNGACWGSTGISLELKQK